jgi:hypothetical protein
MPGSASRSPTSTTASRTTTNPTFVIRLAGGGHFLILETKGYDPLAEVKRQAGSRWINAVNAEGRHGLWQFAMVRRVGEVHDAIGAAASS